MAVPSAPRHRAGWPRNLTPARRSWRAGALTSPATWPTCRCRRDRRRAPRRSPTSYSWGMELSAAITTPTCGRRCAIVDNDAFGLGARRTSLSTVGLAPDRSHGRRRLADPGSPSACCIARNDEPAAPAWVPVNKGYRSTRCAGGGAPPVAKTNRRVTFSMRAHARHQRHAGTIEEMAAKPTAFSPRQPHPAQPIPDSPFQPTSDVGHPNASPRFCAGGNPGHRTPAPGIEINAGCEAVASGGGRKSKGFLTQRRKTQRATLCSDGFSAIRE